MGILSGDSSPFGCCLLKYVRPVKPHVYKCAALHYGTPQDTKIIRNVLTLKSIESIALTDAALFTYPSAPDEQPLKMPLNEFAKL
jgi:hypothetical protein